MRTGKFDHWKILVFIELAVVVIVFAGCFGKEKLAYSFDRDSAVWTAVQTEGSPEYESERMELSPGVYCLKVQTELVEEQSAYVNVQAEETNYKSLRNNGMIIFAGNDQARFLVYVLERIPGAYVHCTFTESDIDSLVQVELYQTKLGNRMFLFLLVTGFLLADFLIWFRRGIVEKKISGKQQVVFWTLTAGVLIAFFPYLTDYITFGADSVYHISRIAFLKDSLQQGSLIPVRMQCTWLCGHGYATSLFYGELFLYIPALLMLIGFSIMAAYKIFIVIVLAATAAIAYFCFNKCVEDEYAALFGSMIYLLTPYHLLNIYNRAAVGEYLAMTFYPLVCCGMYLLYTKDVTSKEYGKYKWYVIFGMSALLQSHLISTEMTIVLMALVCLIFWKKTLRRQTFCQLLEAAGIVLILNVWFWVPLLYMMRADSYVLESVIQEKGQARGTLIASYLQLLPNSGGGQTGMWNAEPVQPGAGGLIILAAYYLRRLRHREEKNGICGILAAFSVLLLVMSTRYVPWDVIMKIPGIGYIVGSLQFPSRWMAPATVMIGMFSAFFFKLIWERGGSLSKAALGVGAIVSVGAAMFYVNDFAMTRGPSFLYNVENMGTLGVVNGEYLLEGTAAEDFYYHKPTAEDGLIYSDYEKNGTNVRMLLENITDETHFIEIPLTGYRGYEIRQEGEEAGDSPYITEERGSHGDLRIAVPGGYRGVVHISYQGFALFHVAEAVSLISLAAILAICFYRRKNRRPTEQVNGG